MRNVTIEMRVGEAIRVGQYTVRLLDVEDGELCLEIDPGLDGDAALEEFSELCEAFA